MSAHVSIPTTARLPGSLRLEPSHPVVAKLIGRLSRASLLTLAVQWLNDTDGPLLSAPYLRPPKRRTGRFRRRSGRSSDGSGGGSGDVNETILDDSDEQNDDDDDSDDDDDEGSMYPASRTIDDLREVYAQLQAGNTRGSRRELADRILEGDWRRGLTLHQLAMADLQYLHDHPLSQRWSAFRIVSLKLRPENAAQENDEEPVLEIDGASLVVPRIHPPSFLRSLQGSLPPDVKTHCSFERHRDLPVLLLRIFIFDTPYATELAAGGRGRRGKRKRRRGGGDDDDDDSQANAGGDASMPPSNLDTARTVYVAFPDASAHVYVSAATTASASAITASSASTGGGDTKSLRSLVVEGIPKALSRPGERYALRPTSLSTRNMAELVDRRGGGRGGSGSAGGGWGSVYGDEKIRESPLDSALPTPPLSSAVSEDEGNGPSKEGAARVKSRGAAAALSAEERAAKRRKLVARARFGTSGLVDDGLGVERVDVAIEDPFPQSSSAVAAVAEDRRCPRNTGRGKQAGGRRSTLDAALEREAALLVESDRDDNDDGGEEQTTGEDNDTTEARPRSKSRWRPGVKLTFRGSHVFAGIRQLVETGAIDGERMPGWMTGEEGVTIGTVRNGRIRGHKGSGL